MKRGIKGKNGLRKGLSALEITPAAEVRRTAYSEGCITSMEEE